MIVVARESRRRFRFSLRDLFLVTTLVAILVCFFAWVGREASRASIPPSNVEYWLSLFHTGTPQERETAAMVIASLERNGSDDQRTLGALREAAIDKNANIRSAAVLGLDKTANGEKRAHSVLQQLADGDPDDDVRSMARQALTRGIP